MAYRVLTYVREENLDAVLAAGVDGAVIDLADASVEPSNARAFAKATITRLREHNLAAIVRVNHRRTGLLREDLEAVVGEGVEAVILPHCTETQDVRRLAVLLRELELPREIEPGSVSVFPTVDTPRGLLRAADLTAAAPRVAGLLFDSAAYALSVGARAEEWGPRLAYARGACVAAARAAGGLPLIDADGGSSRRLAYYGFAGILLSDPSQAAAARAGFVPSAAERERASEIVEAYESAKAAGASAGRSGRLVVDSGTARMARERLS